MPTIAICSLFIEIGMELTNSAAAKQQTRCAHGQQGKRCRLGNRSGHEYGVTAGLGRAAVNVGFFHRKPEVSGAS